MEVGKDQPADQVAADDKEYVDAKIAAFEPRDASMVQDHRKNSDGPQTIDFRAVSLFWCRVHWLRCPADGSFQQRFGVGGYCNRLIRLTTR